MEFIYFIIAVIVIIVLIGLFIQIIFPLIGVLIVVGIVLAIVNSFRTKKQMNEYNQQSESNSSYYREAPQRKPKEDVIDVEYTERVDHAGDEWN